MVQSSSVLHNVMNMQWHKCKRNHVEFSSSVHNSRDNDYSMLIALHMDNSNVRIRPILKPRN